MSVLAPGFGSIAASSSPTRATARPWILWAIPCRTAPVKIAEKHYVGVVIVHKDRNTNRFYLREVILRDALQRQPFKTEAMTGKDAALNGGHAGAFASMVRETYSINADQISKAVYEKNGYQRWKHA